MTTTDDGRVYDDAGKLIYSPRSNHALEHEADMTSKKAEVDPRRAESVRLWAWQDFKFGGR